ncbi:unnamed protein product, partial [Oppiella nova]
SNPWVTTPPVPPLTANGDIVDYLSESVDYKSDAKKLREQLDSEAMDLEEDLELKPDPLVGIDSAELVIDATLEMPYDVLLTKVDIEYGVYGLYNFYKMQIIEHKAKDLVLLFTRWGRVGDTGQYQKTPFATAEAAVAEFKKIFKAKS